MESIILKKLKAITTAKLAFESEHLDDYDQLIEWKLLQSNSDLLWSILDELPTEDPDPFDTDEELKAKAEVNGIASYIEADL